MIIYLINLIVVAFAAVMGTYYYKNRTNLFGENILNNFWFCIIFLSLFLTSSLRWRVGSDYWNYEHIFEKMKGKSISEAFNSSTEYGFAFLSWLIIKVSNEPMIAFAFFAFITISLIILSLRDYSSFFHLSIILYITTMAYYSSFNGIRQWVASAILFFGYRYLIKMNFLKFSFFVLIASLFHTTALIMLPLHFLVKKKFYSITNLLIIGVFIIGSFAFDSFIQVLLSFVENTEYADYDEWFKQQGRGANFLRFAVSLTPVIIGISFYNRLIGLRKDFDVLLNFSILNAMFMLLALNNNIFARFTYYTELYNLLLIPLFTLLSSIKVNRFVNVMILFCYLIYMILLLPVDSSLLPYRTIFTR